jgi:hypothetical protein
MITALTTVMNDGGRDPWIAGLTALALILLLVEREIAVAIGARAQPVARSLLVSIVPLLVVFAIIVSSRLLRFP